MPTQTKIRRIPPGFGDYVNRLNQVDFEKPAPMLPGQGLPPFGFNLPSAPQFQSEENLKILSDYARAYTDFWFTFNFTGNQAIPAGGTIPIPKRIQNDSFFAAMFWVIYYDSENSGPFTVQFSDASRNLQFFDEPCDIRLCQGTPTDFFWFPNMIVFNPNSSMMITITDLNVLGDLYTVKVLLGGRRYHT